MTTTFIEPVIPVGKRPRVTKAQRVRVFDANGGKCHLCGLPIQHGQEWDVEHPKMRELGGSDRLEDLRPAHVDCHKPKTAADVAIKAKVTRTRAAHLGIKSKSALAGRTREQKRADRDAKSAGRIPLPPRKLPPGFVSAASGDQR